MSPPTTPPANWSIKAVPAAFALSLIPHSYYLFGLMAATKNQMSIAMCASPSQVKMEPRLTTIRRPRTNLDTWKSKLPAATWNHLARARGAHLNSMEVFPLFAASIIAGNVANLPARDLNNAALSFLAARTLYMGVYMSVKSDTLAYVRTGVYTWSISIPIMLLWKAGNALAASDGKGL